MRSFLILLLALGVVGCAQTSSTSTPQAQSPEAATEATVAGTPKIIDHLTSETTIFTCPTCGMMFDAAGTCSMGCAKLVETKVAYICPADNKPVEHSGKCERCAMDARIEKTAVAAVTVPPVVSGN